MPNFPTDSAARKAMPITEGCLDYFPDAIAAVSRVSKKGNDKHNPGQPMHWAREKSKDHRNCIARHLMEPHQVDEDGELHSVHLAWRALANAQLEIEAQRRGWIGKNQSRTLQEFFGFMMGFPLVRLSESNIALPSDKEMAADEVRVDNPPRVLYTNPVGDISTDIDEVRLAGRKLNRQERLDAIHHFVGCGSTSGAACLIVSGITVPDAGERQYYFERTSPEQIDEDSESRLVRVVYVAGPMRGKPKANFPAFDEARDRLVSQNFGVISPADIDRSDGITGDNCDENSNYNSAADGRSFAYRDFNALHGLTGECGDGIAMLPGWEGSSGATSEFFLARWMRLAILDATTGLPLKSFDRDLLASTVARTLAQQS